MYAKLFTSIFQGTMRGNSHALLVFTNLLAHADAHGIADIHPRAISEEVGLTLEQTKDALLYLEQQDLESRSPEMGGRRIVRMDGHREWGWQVVNYLKYRAIRNEDDRREQNRIAQKKWRESKQSKPRKPESAKGEGEGEGEVKDQEIGHGGKPPSTARGSKFSLTALPDDWLVFCKGARPKLDPEDTFSQFRDHWLANANRPTAKKSDWFAAWRTWIRREKP